MNTYREFGAYRTFTYCLAIPTLLAALLAVTLAILVMKELWVSPHRWLTIGWMLLQLVQACCAAIVGLIWV
jgi:hypothetical protein